MIRALALSVFLLIPASIAAAPLDAGKAYEACLIGSLVLDELRDGEGSFADATEACEALAALVPDDYPGEPAESYGPALVEENALHYWENVVAPKLVR